MRGVVVVIHPLSQEMMELEVDSLGLVYLIRYYCRVPIMGEVVLLLLAIAGLVAANIFEIEVNLNSS